MIPLTRQTVIQSGQRSTVAVLKSNEHKLNKAKKYVNKIYLINNEFKWNNYINKYNSKFENVI